LTSVIRFEAPAGVARGHLPKKGSYLRDFDVDAAGGVGVVRWTTDLTKAMKFPNARTAMLAWQTQSTQYPIRPWDGKPNRPLTAYTVTIEDLEEK
jgi:hypothetical protein